MLAIPHRIKTSQLNLPRRSSPNCRLKSCLKNHNINTRFQQAGEGSSSRKRGSSPATIPSSKRRKEKEEDAGKVEDTYDKAVDFILLDFRPDCYKLRSIHGGGGTGRN